MTHSHDHETLSYKHYGISVLRVERPNALIDWRRKAKDSLSGAAMLSV